MKSAPYVVLQSRKIRVIIDTDCACEADDHYAIAHQLMTPKFDVVGITAAHFGGWFSPEGLEDSAGKSFAEAQKIVDLIGLQEQIKVYHGSTRMMPDEKTPVDSEASRFIVAEAMKDDSRPWQVGKQAEAGVCAG